MWIKKEEVIERMVDRKYIEKLHNLAVFLLFQCWTPSAAVC
jgi:hypothetical protein